MLRKIFLAFLFTGSLIAAHSGPTEDRLKAIDAKDYPGANVVVVFDSTFSNVQESGLTYVNMHRLYKVMTPAGALQLSVIKIDYDPLSAYVDIKKVVVYKGGEAGEQGSGEAGKQGSLEAWGHGGMEDTAQVLDYPAPARMIYWGAREKMIEVGRLEPGDAVEVWLFRKGFTYALLGEEPGDDDKYIPPMKGQFYDIVPFYSDDPIVEKVYRAIIPADKVLQYRFYNGEAQTSAVRQGDMMTYTFSKKDIKPLKHEPNMVDFSDVAPKLLLSTSPDWYAKSKWFYQVNEDFGSFEYTPEIKAKVDLILRNAKSEMDSVSLLTHWVADEVRYSGISMGCGEGYTLHKGSMTFTDRCGVCKDKAGMLVTMLRAAGFKSYAAMTMAGSRIDYIPADQFNHSVTVVKLRDGKYHLLDPTWVPFIRELWSSAEQQQNFLRGLPEGSDLLVTPVSPPDHHYIRISGTSALSSEGTLDGELTIRAEGQSDGAIRRMFTGNYKDQWQHNVEMELKRVNPSAEMLSVDYGNPYAYQEGPIKIVLKYRIPFYAIVNGDEIIMKSFIASGFLRRSIGNLMMDTHSETKVYPFRDRCSRQVQLTETITLPGKYQIVYKPEVETFSDTTASFVGSYEIGLDGNTLQMSQLANFDKRVYQPQEWPSFRQATLAETKFIDEPVILKKSNN
jgi:transglutaminase-like putative cysteine protease